jgi:hypothetical protein
VLPASLLLFFFFDDDDDDDGVVDGMTDAGGSDDTVADAFLFRVPFPIVAAVVVKGKVWVRCNF